MSNPILYYFPGNLKYPFGHVAIGIDTVYLTYTKGEGKTKDPIQLTSSLANDIYVEEFHLDFSMENHIYKGAITINLPSCAPDALHCAIQQFNELNRKDYNIFTKNCATAVIDFMKNIGCIPENEKFYPPIRPQTIAKRACEIALHTIQAERKRIKASNKYKSPIQKIIALLLNDIERLKEQIKYDEIAHFVFKSKDTKLKKIETLDALAKLGQSALIVNLPEDFGAFREALINAKNLGSKTAHHINECLYYFPPELLPRNYSRKEETQKKDEHFYKDQQEFILADDELNETEILLELLDNDIQRLESTKSKTKKDEIDKPKVAIYQLESPVNYGGLLNYLEQLITDKGMSKTTSSHLQSCIDRFPYDRLPRVEQMRKFLMKINHFLSGEEKQQKGLTLFSGKKMPTSIKLIRDILPYNTNTETLSFKAVYESFTKIDAILTARMASAEKTNVTLKSFYDYANRLAAVVTGETSGPNSLESRRGGLFRQ